MVLKNISPMTFSNFTEPRGMPNTQQILNSLIDKFLGNGKSLLIHSLVISSTAMKYLDQSELGKTGNMGTRTDTERMEVAAQSTFLQNL